MTPDVDYPAEIQRMKDEPYPSYEVPLKVVRRWVRGDRPAVLAAVEALRCLRERYPFAIKLGDELVLALLQLGDLDTARSELKALEREFKDQFNEETLCRLGRIHRDIGDTYAFPQVSGAPDFRRALPEYVTAWEHYHRAFGIRSGHYPGINVAALYLLRAWATTEADARRGLIREAHETVQRLLTLREKGKWPRDLPDDAIWHKATEGDAHLLLGQARTAGECYRDALALADQTFYKGSIGKQVRRLRPVLQECCGVPAGELDAIEALFR